MVLKTSDQSFTSGSYADVTGLTFSVSAGKTYLVWMNLVANVATGTVLRLAMNGPTSSLVVVNGTTGTDTAGNAFDSPWIAVTGVVDNGAAGGMAIVKTTNGGTLAVRALRYSGSNAATVKAGSSIMYMQLD